MRHNIFIFCFILFSQFYIFQPNYAQANPVDDLREMQIDLDNMVARSLGEIDDITKDRILDLKKLIEFTINEFDQLIAREKLGVIGDIQKLKNDIFAKADSIIFQGESIISTLVDEARCHVQIIKTTAAEFKIFGSNHLEKILREQEAESTKRLNAHEWFRPDTLSMTPREIMETYYSLARLTNAVACEARLTIGDAEVSEFYTEIYKHYSRKASLWGWAVNLEGKI